MRLLMVSGDRQVAAGLRGPFHSMLRGFSTHFERIDVLAPRPPGPVTTREVFGNVHVHPASCGRMGMVSYIAKRGAALVREFGHGLIVSHDYGTFYNGRGAARVAAATNIPFVSELHHVPGHPVAATATERLEKALAKKWVSWAQERVRAFRVVNHGEMPALLREWGVPEAKILVLPSLYLDLDVFHPDPNLAPPPADSGGGTGLGTKPGAERYQDVVFVGRLVVNKGVERLVDALGILASKGQNATAVIVGTGPLAQRVCDRIQERGIAPLVRSIDWLDSPEELASIYRHSRVCVCASTSEGGPRFTVEAMACGTPVVSTPVGVMSDLLGDGTAGRLAGFDAESLAEAIGDVLADEDARLAMGRAALGLAAPHAYDAAIRNYAEGLKRVAGQGQLSP